MSTYVPAPGDLVRVQRFEVPTPELPGLPERRLLVEYAGTVDRVRPVADGVIMHLAGLEDAIFTGTQHSGQDPEHGCSWSLRTEVVLQSEATAHDLAGLDDRVRLAEREHAAVLASWEQARRAEIVARQRLTGAQARLEAATSAAGLARRDAAAQADQAG
jgi:hypothetical protein